MCEQNVKTPISSWLEAAGLYYGLFNPHASTG